MFNFFRFPAPSGSAFQVSALLEELFGQLRRSFSTQVSLIFHRTADQELLLLRTDPPAAIPAQPIILSSPASWIARSLRDEKAIILHPSEAIQDRLLSSFRLFWLVVPIRVGATYTGVLALGRAAAWKGRDTERLLSVIPQWAGDLERFYLHERNEDQRWFLDRLDQLTARVGQGCQVWLMEAVRLLGLQAGELCFWNPRHTEVRSEWRVGELQEDSGRGIGIPIVWEEQSLGGMNLYFKGERGFTTGDFRLLRLLCHQAAAIFWSRRESSKPAGGSELVEVIARHAADAVVVTDREGKILWFSDGASSLLGYSSEAIVDRPIEVLYPQGLHSERDWLMEKVQSEGKIRSFETFRLTREGKRIAVELTVVGVYGQEGVIEQVIEILRDISERKRSEREILDRNRELEAISSLTAVMNLSLGLKEVLDSVLRKTVELVGVEAGLLLGNGRGKELHLLAAQGVSDEGLNHLCRSDPIAAIDDFSRIPEGNSFTVEQIPASLRSLAEREGWQHFTPFEVRHKEQAYGILMLGSNGAPSHLTRRHRLISSITNHIGLLLENNNLYEREQERVRLLGNLNEAALAITGEEDLQALLTRMAEMAKRLTNADWAAIEVVGTERAHSGFIKIIGDSGLGERNEMVRAALAFLLKDGKPIRLDRLRGGVRSYSSLGGVIGIPLVFKGQVIGGLLVASLKERGGFSDESEGLVTILASQATTAIINTRLYSEFAERTNTAEIFNRFAELIGFITNEQEILDAAVLSARQLLPADTGIIYLAKDPEDVLYVGATWGEIGPSQLKEAKSISTPTCWAIRRGGLFVVNRADTDLHCRYDPVETGKQSYLCAPLTALGRTIGVIHVLSRSQNAFGERHREWLTRLADQVSLALGNVRLMASIQHQAFTDPLTGLYNMRFFRDHLEKELARATRVNEPISLLVIDVDNFKPLNDIYGHDVGDSVLKGFSRVLLRQIRTADLAARYGGEEFVVVLPNTQPAEGIGVAEKIRTAVQDTRFTGGDQANLLITVSIGVASFPTSAINVDDLFRAADSQMYHAKAAGKNRVVGGFRNSARGESPA